MSPRPPYLFFGSPPLSPIVLRVLAQYEYMPALHVQDTSLTVDEQIELVLRHNAAFILVAGYGKILRRDLLDSVAGQVLNIHPSLLPAYRGPSPVVQTILDGVHETGVTVIEIDREVDHGPILAQESLPLRGDETASDLYEVLTQRGTRLFLDVIDEYLDGTLDMLPQDHSEASFTTFVKKEDGLLIPTQSSAEEMERMVRAYAGWPGTWLLDEDKRLKVHKAHVSQGALVLDEVQPESGKRMSFAAYCAGKRTTAQAIEKRLGL